MSTFIYILYILLAIVILLFMVLVHELGHYIAGRILKFKITEFSIGFGKAIFSKTNKRGEKISLRIFPLGGYCSFAGEGDDKENPKEGDFNSFAPWKRIVVFFAGVFMNFVTAIFFSLILLCTYGGRDIVKVTEINPNYSEVAVLQQGDVIYEIGNEKLDIGFGTNYQTALSNQFTNAQNYAKENEEKEITDYRFSVKVRHVNNVYETYQDVSFYKLPFSSKEKDLEEYSSYKNINVCSLAQLDEDGNVVVDENGKTVFDYYSLGINIPEFYVHTFWEALGRCVSYSFGLAWLVLKSLWQLITFQIAIKSIGGPITTIATIATVSQTNFANLLILIPLISANLAVFNLLPFPALDGSHIMFTTIEWIRKKPINRKVENIIHFVGLCILFTFVIIVDILHFVL